MDSYRLKEPNMAFYKYDGEILLEGPNFVDGPEFSLHIETKDQYTYPVHDWYWFDSRIEALNFYGIIEEE